VDDDGFRSREVAVTRPVVEQSDTAARDSPKSRTAVLGPPLVLLTLHNERVLLEHRLPRFLYWSGYVGILFLILATQNRGLWEV
jgi:hypothetical protein